MTTKGKKNHFYYSLDESYFNKKSTIILSQIRVIDNSRFIEHLWTISQDDYENVIKKLKALIL